MNEDRAIEAPNTPPPGKNESSGKYVVLARRYRPTQFEQVIGQQHVTRTLQNAIRANRVHHAFLFTGSRGIGKTTVARILARALNHPGGPTPTPPPPDPDAPALIDVIEIDGASNTGVDDVRELRDSIRYMPQHSRFKIYIIDEVHMLSTSAFNALLKTLEEPPSYVKFVFATTEPHKIPATILSRCQRFDFKRVATSVLIEHMQHLLAEEKIAVEPAGLSTIARAAEGGVRDSLSLLDQVIAFSAAGDSPITAAEVAEVLGVADRRSLFALSSALLERDAPAALEIISTLFADGHDLSQFAQTFVGHLRDLVVCASCDDPAPLVEATEAELADLQAQAQKGGRPLWQQHFDRFAFTAEQIARSTFAKLLLEMVLVEMVHAEPLMPLGDLLDRLEDLERRTASGRPDPGTGGTSSRGAAKGPAASTRRRGSSQSAEPASGPSPEPVATMPSEPPAEEAAAPKKEPPRPEPQPPVTPPAEAVTAHANDTSQEPDDERQPRHGSSAEAARATPAEANGKPADSSGATVLAAGSTLERWQQVLRSLGGPQAATYASGKLISWEGTEVVLGYLAGAFELGMASDAERRRLVEERLGELVGHPMTITVRQLTEKEEQSPELARLSAIEANQQQVREDRRKLQDEARSHPIIRALVADFGAQIRTIRTALDSKQAL